MRRRDAYGRELDDDETAPVDYASLLRPGATPMLHATQTLQAAPLAAPPSVTAAPPGTAPPSASASPSVPQVPGGRAPVAGSRFVDYGHLFNLNAGKAQASAQRLASRAEAAATEAKARLAGAQAAFDERVRTGSGEDYNGQAFVTPGMFPGEKGQTLYGGAKTPEQMAALAAQQYVGPESLAKLPGFDELTGAANKAQQYTGALGSQEGLQALLQAQNAALGGYGTLPTSTSGKGRWDAAMARTAGGENFDALAERYSGLMRDIEKANVASKSDADRARARTEAERLEWAGVKGKQDEAFAARKAEDDAKAEAAKAEAATDAARRGKPGYDDFMKLSVPEAIRRGHKATDIAGGALGAVSGGEWSPLNFVTDGLDKMLGQAGASSGERAKNAFSQAERYGVNSREVYDSMTPDEVAAMLANKDDRKTADFIMKRWKELQSKRGGAR